MLFNIASVVLALQLGMPGHALSDGQAAVQEIQYRVPVRPPPCDHGWDVSARDRMCYPNGYLPPKKWRLIAAGITAAGATNRGGRYPVPCGHGADVDIRDGQCYPNGIVPPQFQEAGFALGTIDTSPPA